MRDNDIALSGLSLAAMPLPAYHHASAAVMIYTSRAAAGSWTANRDSEFPSVKGWRNMAMPKKPNAVFEVYFQGKGLYPENIPLGPLTTALSAIRRLATGSEAADEEEEEEAAQLARRMGPYG